MCVCAAQTAFLATFLEPSFWQCLSVVIPMWLVTLVNNLANIEAASAVGDHYSARAPLLGCALIDLTCALLGNPFPSCVYIGHAAFKAMGCRCEALGGGRIERVDEGDGGTVHIYGFSVGFGGADGGPPGRGMKDHAETSKLVRQMLPKHTVTFSADGRQVLCVDKDGKRHVATILPEQSQRSTWKCQKSGRG